MGHGRRRPGAGKPKGFKHQKTLDKEAMRELVRTRVAAELGPMIDAQISAAKGLKYRVTRSKKGRQRLAWLAQRKNRGRADHKFVNRTRGERKFTDGGKIGTSKIGKFGKSKIGKIDPPAEIRVAAMTRGAPSILLAFPEVLDTPVTVKGGERSPIVTFHPKPSHREVRGTNAADSWRNM